MTLPPTLPPQPTIRRRTNGTIDIDHYRETALMMRRGASRDMARKARPLLRALVAGATLLTAFGVIRDFWNAGASMPRAATKPSAVVTR